MNRLEWLVCWNNIFINVGNVCKMKFLWFQKKRNFGNLIRGFQKWMYFAGVNFRGSERISLFQFNLNKWPKSYFLGWTLQLSSKICLIVRTLRGLYSRPLLGTTIEPNLVPWILKNMFSLEMVRRCALKICTHVPNI